MKTSQTIEKIIPALVKASGELSNPPKNGMNPHFKSKYTTLDELINHIRPVMASNKLCVKTPATTNEEGVSVSVIILHESAEWIEFEPFTIPLVKRDAQSVGSATTYATRYALCAALGLAGSDDDDANEATKKPEKQSKQKQPTISQEEIEQAYAWMNEKGYSKQGLERAVRKNFACTLNEFPKDKWQQLMDLILNTEYKQEKTA